MAIDRTELLARSLAGAPARLIEGTTGILARHAPTRHTLERLVGAAALPPYTDYVCRIVVAYPWRMGVERCGENLLAVARLLCHDQDARASLATAVCMYAEAWEEDEARRGKRCRIYVPHMVNWLTADTWRQLVSPHTGTMGSAQRAYEEIKRARHS